MSGARREAEPMRPPSGQATAPPSGRFEGTVRRSPSPAAALRRLAELPAHGDGVLSLYLNFDPSRFPSLRERRAQADSLLAELERECAAEESDEHERRMALRESVRSLRAFLTDEELAVQPARGLALFTAPATDTVDVVALPNPVEPAARCDALPFVEPLLEQTAGERWCALLVSRRAARILTGTRERLVEVAEATDDVHGKHSQGGWSQRRYERGIEHEVDEHLRGACAVLYEHYGRRRFDRLLIGCPAELRGRVEEELHPDLRGHLAGHFEIDVERGTPDEAHRQALPAIEADERDRELDALERLGEGLAPDGHAAAGLDEVLEALHERRVQTLLVAHGWSAPGHACPRCGRLSASEGPCPLDNETTRPREDVVQDAIESALEQAAGVLIVRHCAEELAERGSIAALLRF